MIDNISIETSSRIAVLETEVKNIASDLKEIRTELTSDLKEIRLEQKQQYDNLILKMSTMDKRLNIIERWRWMLIGGALVIGFFLSQVTHFIK